MKRNTKTSDLLAVLDVEAFSCNRQDRTAPAVIIVVVEPPENSIT